VKILLSLCLVLVSFAAKAQLQNQIHIEWAPAEGALSYTVQVEDATTRSMVKEIEAITTTSTDLLLQPGKYLLRIRSKDQRGIPGAWSNPYFVEVTEPEFEMLSPLDSDYIQSEGANAKVKFEWRGIQGKIFKMDLEIKDTEGEFSKVYSSVESGTTIELESSRRYKYRIHPTRGDPVFSKSEPVRTFQIWGPELQKPQLKLELQDSTELSLQVVPEPYAEQTIVQIHALDVKVGKWTLLQKWQIESAETLQYKVAPNYRLVFSVAYSKSKIRSTSPLVTAIVDLTPELNGNGELMPFFLGQPYKRSGEFSLLAEYRISNAQYSSTNYEYSSNTKTNGLSGTGSVGFSNFFRNSAHGIRAMGHVSGMIVDGRNQPFLSGEAAYLHRYSLGAKTELRSGLGLRYWQTPQFGSPADAELQSGILWSLGPTVRTELWRHLTQKWGFLVNAQYSHMLVGGAPNRTTPYSNGVLEISGALGYRWSYDQLWMIGLQQKWDWSRYPGYGASATSRGENRVEMNTLSLMLSLEWRVK